MKSHEITKPGWYWVRGDFRQACSDQWEVHEVQDRTSPSLGRMGLTVYFGEAPAPLSRIADTVEFEGPLIPPSP